MKRSLRNTIAIGIVVLMCAASVFTAVYAADHSTALTQSSGGQMMQGESNNAPPDSSGGTDSSTDGSADSGQPPEKPDGEGSTSDSSGQPPEKPDGDSDSQSGSDMQQPPDKPDSEDSADSSSQSGENSDETDSSQSAEGNMQPPENNQSDSGQSGAAPDMNSAQNQTSQTLEVKYYALFGAEGLILILALMYLIMTGAGRRTFDETFSGKKAAVCVLAAVILAGGFSFGAGAVTESLAADGSSQQMQAQGGGADSDVSYSTVKDITEDETITEGTFTSENADENAISANGDIDVTLSGITVNKSGDSDGGDATSFYGTNSAIIARGGASLTVENAVINTDATGANGIFSYGGSATTGNSSSDGTTVTVKDTKITTTKDNSGGIMTTGGGIMKAYNLTVSTAGTSSAAIRSDRGGGDVTVSGGTYTTAGQGSPAIYSTAQIKVSDAKLISKASEGIVIEGKNSVSIDNCTLTDTNSKLNGKSTTYKNIFLYQSMSGDAAEGNAEFTAKDSKITTNKGDTLYVTNTTAAITLENNTIVNNDSSGCFLRVQKDSWGNSGENGGDVTLTMTNQKATGDIVVDSISTLKMIMKSGSSYTGTINGDNSAENITLKLDKSSKIKLTGDCYVSSLDNGDATNSNIDFNGYTLYVDGEAVN